MDISVTGSILFLYAQRGREAKKKINYHQEIRATSAYMNRITEGTKGLGQRNGKGATKDFFIFDCWFASKRSDEASIYVGDDIIDMVKINTKIFCKDNIENLINYWQRGSYLVLKSKPMVPGDRQLIAIGYNYNSQKILSLVATEGAGIT